MKYVILADTLSGSTFSTPRQLTKINNETLLERTVRLLKKNKVDDILITSHDERFEVEGATRYEPLHNNYNSLTKTGYWLSAFPIELLNEPICFIWGDVYFSEKAIKTIVETETNSTLFFCTYKNTCTDYIKEHDEPLAYKVVDYELFKKHIDIVKKMYDDGETVRHPIVWELYRSINGQDINVHEMTKNYVAINDVSCDIDGVKDIKKLLIKLGGMKMIKVEVKQDFSLERFDELENIIRKNPSKNEKGKLYLGDIFDCTEEMCDYLTGNNAINKAVVEIIEVIPKKEKVEEIVEASIEEPVEEIKVETKPKKNKKKRK